jgi:hypothetical protein
MHTKRCAGMSKGADVDPEVVMTSSSCTVDGASTGCDDGDTSGAMRPLPAARDAG